MSFFQKIKSKWIDKNIRNRSTFKPKLENGLKSLIASIRSDVASIKSQLDKIWVSEIGLQLEPIADQIRLISDNLPNDNDTMLDRRSRLKETAYLLDLYSPESQKRGSAAFFLSQHGSSRNEWILGAAIAREKEEAVLITLKVAKENLQDKTKGKSIIEAQIKL